MAHPPFLLLLLLLGFHVSHGSPLPPSYDGSMCSESFMCGSVNITYPFYLSDATQETTDYTSKYSCGYTDLQIYCQSEGETKTPFLHLEGDTYTILNISYDNHTIILGDADVLHGSSCPRVSHDVSLGQAWLKYTDSYDNLTFFFDCYSGPDDQPPVDLGKYQIRCNLAAGSGDGVSFVLSSSEGRNVSQEYQLADHCNQSFVVPVHKDAHLRGNPAVLPSEFGALLKRGFELEWDQGTAQTCQMCEQSGGRCAYSESKTFLGCLCSSGKVGDQDCHNTYADSTSSKFYRTRILQSYSRLKTNRR
ncbi:unnamed protein product [Alopecurus aequalis]